MRRRARIIRQRVLWITIWIMLFTTFYLNAQLTSDDSVPSSDATAPLPSSDLRFRPTTSSALSPLAQRIANHQANCRLDPANFWFRNRFGLGSDLHVLSQGYCLAMERNFRLEVIRDWAWGHFDSYFRLPHCNYKSSTTEAQQRENITRGPGRLDHACMFPTSEFRAASTEYLFANLQPVVVREAQRQYQQVFPRHGVPPNLITVHVRWGDKGREMKLLSIEKYVQAVHTIVQERQYSQVHVFLATEDPSAVTAFKEAMPVHWNVYVDWYVQEFGQYHTSDLNHNAKLAKRGQLKAKPGLVALASLLVAIEANDYVLTTKSNWSRLINELRQVVHRQCDNCTHLVDLAPDEW